MERSLALKLAIMGFRLIRPVKCQSFKCFDRRKFVLNFRRQSCLIIEGALQAAVRMAKVATVLPFVIVYYTRRITLIVKGSRRQGPRVSIETWVIFSHLSRLFLLKRYNILQFFSASN